MLLVDEHAGRVKRAFYRLTQFARRLNLIETNEPFKNPAIARDDAGLGNVASKLSLHQS